VKVHVNRSYNTYLFVGHFCSTCYIANLNTSSLIFTRQYKKCKSLQAPWPVSKHFSCFPAPRNAIPVPQDIFPASTNATWILHPSRLSKTLVFTHCCITVFRQSMHIKRQSPPQPASDSLQEPMKQSHLTGTHSPPHRDELPLPCTATKAGSGDAHFDFPVMALTSENSFLI